jgi:hypothetical protein
VNVKVIVVCVKMQWYKLVKGCYLISDFQVPIVFIIIIYLLN